MIYYDTVKSQLTQQELDGNFEQLLLKARKLGADMSLTLRKDLTRPLTPREMDTNFQSLDLAVKKARYGDGPYPAAEYIFDGATVLPAGITFTRSGEATYIKNGRLLTADIDEPVFEHGGPRLELQRTNQIANSKEGNYWSETAPAYRHSDEEFIVSTETGFDGHTIRRYSLNKAGFLNVRTTSTSFSRLPNIPSVFVRSNLRYCRSIVSSTG